MQHNDSALPDQQWSTVCNQDKRLRGRGSGIRGRGSRGRGYNWHSQEAQVTTMHKEPVSEQKVSRKDRIFTRVELPNFKEWLKIICENNIESGYINIEKVKKEINIKLEDEDLSSDCKCALLSVVISYAFHEVLDLPLVKDFLNTMHFSGIKTKYPALHWLFWPGYKKMPISGLNRSIDDIKKTIEILYDMGYNPLKKNDKSENAIQSLDESIKKGYLSSISSSENDLREQLYFILMRPNTSSILSMMTRIFNVLAPSSEEEIFNTVRWLFSLNSKIFCEEFVNSVSMLDLYGSSFPLLKSRLELVVSILKKEPSKDITFEKYFRKYYWKETNLQEFFMLTKEIVDTRIKQGNDYIEILYAIWAELTEDINEVYKEINTLKESGQTKLIAIVISHSNINNYDVKIVNFVGELKQILRKVEFFELCTVVEKKVQDKAVQEQLKSVKGIE